MSIKYTKEILEQAVSNCTTLSDVVRYLGKKPTGSSHRHIRQRIDHYNISTSHFRYIRPRLTKETLEKDVLTKNRLDRRENARILRKALLESGREHKCEKCGLKDQWNNQPIVLQIDHINGDWSDNTKENLRFLCPNCHSQTENYAAKKKSKVVKIKEIKIKQPRQSNRPNKEILEKQIWEIPTIQLAKTYKVSDKAIEKWCKYYNISKPPRGYWQKKDSLKI